MKVPNWHHLYNLKKYINVRENFFNKHVTYNIPFFKFQQKKYSKDHDWLKGTEK